MNNSQQYVKHILQLFKSMDTAQGVAGTKYWGRFEAEGQAFQAEHVDRQKSRALRFKHGLHNRQCYLNAALLATRCNLTYMEGIACAIIPTEHAWLLDPASGQVIEPTWITMKPFDADYYGVAIPTARVLEAAGEKGCYGPVLWQALTFPPHSC